MAYNSSAKADFKKQRASTYVPFYGQTGFGKVPQRLGFKVNVQVIKKSNYDQLLKELAEADFVSLDTETTSLKWDEAQLVSINVGLPGNNNYVGFYYRGFFDKDKVDNLVDDSGLDALVGAILAKPVVFMWNRYFDQRILMHTRGFKEEQFWTCFSGDDLLWGMDSNVKQGFGLKQAAQDFLGLPDWGMDEDVWPDILTIDPRLLVSYGGTDAYATVELGMLLYRIYKKHYSFMLQLHIEFKNALFAFTEQEQVLDAPLLERLSAELAASIEKIKEQFFSTYGTINLASSQQKSALLLRLGYNTGVWNKPGKNGEKIMSTAEKCLAVLAKKGCEPADLMIRYNKLLKLQSSYISLMLDAAKSGKPVRLNIKDHDVATLRLSAGAYRINRKPYDYFLGCSIQTLPKPHKVNRELNYDPKTFGIEWASGWGQYYVESGAPEMNVRAAFCAKPGGLIVKADFAQEELVVGACLANETVWLDAIKAGGDLHKVTGKMVYGRDITGDERKKIKGLNFGILYETDNPEYVVSNLTGWPIEQSREFFAKYKSALSRLYAWKDKVMMEGRTTGSIKNLFGFERRVYSYFHTANRAMHRFGDRTCVSQSIQGLCAILMRILMVKFWKMLYVSGGKYYGSGISLLASVHDELVLRADDVSVLPEFLPDFKSTMSSVTPHDWSVQLRAEVEIGKNFGETFVVERDDASGLWLPKEEKRPETVQEVVPATVTEEVLSQWVDEFEEDLAETEGFTF